MRMRGMIVVVLVMMIVIIALTVRLDVLLTQSKFPYRLASDTSLYIPTRESAISVYLAYRKIISVCATQRRQRFLKHRPASVVSC